MSIRLSEEDVDHLLTRLDTVEKELGEIRGILAGRFQFKKDEPKENSGSIVLDINVSGIEFKQRNGKIAGSSAKWGWAFAFTQDGDYHPESKELVQAIEQYGKVQVDNREYTLGGRDGNLLNMREAG